MNPKKSAQAFIGARFVLRAWNSLTHRNLLLLAHWEGSGYLLNGGLEFWGNKNPASAGVNI